jgi:hypothetical protein
VEELGAGSRIERVEALPESAPELVGSHCPRLRRRTVAPRVGYRRLLERGSTAVRLAKTRTPSA